MKATASAILLLAALLLGVALVCIIIGFAPGWVWGGSLGASLALGVLGWILARRARPAGDGP